MASGAPAVLVTGCSSGIGRAIAVRLAGAGWTVYASARRLPSIADLESSGCRLLELDVTDEASMRRAVDAVEAEHGAISALVNNAGYSQGGAVEEVAMDDIRRQFETNVFGLVRLTQLVLPGMRRQGWGRVVNISSMGGRLVFPGAGFYHATKFAVEAISDALRWEVRPFGIHVVVVEPGLIRTRFGETAASTAAGAAAPDSPYAEFNREVATRTEAAYGMPLAAGPDAVAKVVERALRARRPRTRYIVTLGARGALWARRLLPDRAWDLILRTQFTPPGSARRD